VQPHAVHTFRLPAIWAFSAFLLCAALSVVNSWDQAASLKYVIRPVLFFYVVYVVLVVNTITTKRLLMHVLWLMYLVGVLIAVYGAVGFFLVDAESFLQRRAAPFGIGGVYPLGTNHNLIADVMVTTVPVGLFLISQAKRQLNRKWIFLGTIVMLSVALGTFSRSAWLALCVELIVLFALYYRTHMRSLLRYVGVAAVIAIPFVAYIFFFSTQDAVSSSTQNRLILSDIAQEMFSEYPLFGAGAGTFVSYVENNRVYMQEFGAPLDAHGFVFKVGSEMGIFGLLSYVALLITIVVILIRAFWRAAPPTYDVLCVSMLMMAAGSIFFQLFQTSYFVSKLWFPLGVALAAAYQSEYRRLHHTL
jgi:O-antigen ligase